MNYNNPPDSLAVKYRWTILHAESYMEALLNMYIAVFFCGDTDKADEMQKLILGDERMSLKSKIDVFSFIARNHDSSWYYSYKGVGKELNTDLIHIMEQRNIFAHRIIDDNVIYKQTTAPQGTVRFLKFKNSLSVDDYTEEKFNKLLKTIDGISAFLLSRL